MLVLLLFGACGQNDPTGAIAPAENGEAATPTPAPQPLEGASCEPHEGGNEEAAMFLTDAQARSHEGHDRIVFEFEPRDGAEAEMPFYRIEPTAPPLTELGSGNEVEVDGSAYLGAVLWATGVDFDGEEARAVYTGPKSIKPGDTSTVEEVREAGDFESTMQWYVGTSDEACYRVTENASPPQIIIDVENPAASDGGE